MNSVQADLFHRLRAHFIVGGVYALLLLIFLLSIGYMPTDSIQSADQYSRIGTLAFFSSLLISPLLAFWRIFVSIGHVASIFVVFRVIVSLVLVYLHTTAFSVGLKFIGVYQKLALYKFQTIESNGVSFSAFAFFVCLSIFLYIVIAPALISVGGSIFRCFRGVRPVNGGA